MARTPAATRTFRSCSGLWLRAICGSDGPSHARRSLRASGRDRRRSRNRTRSRFRRGRRPAAPRDRRPPEVLVKRPVGACSAWCLATVSGSPPCASATLAATPWSPSQSPVETGPGLTVLTRTPRGPTSFDSDLEKLASGFGGAVVDHAGSGRNAFTEQVLTIVPCRACSMLGKTARVVRTAARPQHERLQPLIIGDREESIESGCHGADVVDEDVEGAIRSADATSFVGPSAVDRSTLTCRTWPPSISSPSSSRRCANRLRRLRPRPRMQL